MLEPTNACNNLPLVNRNGEEVATPPPTNGLTNACLFLPEGALELYTLEDIRDKTNGAEDVVTDPLAANTPILLTALHLNRQYARMLYNNLNGDPQPEMWVNLEQADISRQSACIRSEIVFIDPNALPDCDADLGQVLNCNPDYEINAPRIFNGEPAEVRAEFLSTGLGCANNEEQNANPKICWGNPEDPTTRPCPLLPVDSTAHCGIDLATEEDAEPGVIGPKDVYTYAGGIIQSYSASSGTLRVEVTDEDGSTDTRYSYTHLSLQSDLLLTTDEYIAAGILLGEYGPIGKYGEGEDDQHVYTVQINTDSNTYSEPPWN